MLFNKLEITNFIGKCHVYINIYRPTHIISLHAKNPQIKINSAILISKASFEQEHIPQDNTYNNESYTLNFHFIEEIPRGNYSLIMHYTGYFNDNESIFKYSYVNSTGHKM